MQRLKFLVPLTPLLIVLILVASIAFSRLSGRERMSTQVVEPGVVLTTMQQVRETGPVQTFVLSVDVQSGWRLRLAPAAYSVLKRTRVSAMAAQHGAVAAVNGGYFAYEGAAVG